MTRGPQTPADASVSPGHPLFEIIDDKGGAVDRLSGAEPDRVVDECYQQALLCEVPVRAPTTGSSTFPGLLLRRDTDLSPECHVVFPESSGLGG